MSYSLGYSNNLIQCQAHNRNSKIYGEWVSNEDPKEL